MLNVLFLTDLLKVMDALDLRAITVLEALERELAPIVR